MCLFVHVTRKWSEVGQGPAPSSQPTLTISTISTPPGLVSGWLLHMTSLGRPVRDPKVSCLFEARPIRRFPPLSFHTSAEAWETLSLASTQSVSIPDYCLQICWSAGQSPSVSQILSELSSSIDFPFLTINVPIPNPTLIRLLFNKIWMRHAYVSQASALAKILASGS